MPQKRPSRVNVLFTSIGRRVELLRAFLRAYAVLGLEGILVGVDVDPLAPGLQIVNRGYIVPSVGSDEYISALEAICRREEISLVLPLIDPDIPVLARACPMLEAAGARVGVVSQAAAALTADKWRTNHFFETIGLATPKSWLPDEMRATTRREVSAVHQAAGRAAQVRTPFESRIDVNWTSSWTMYLSR